MDSVQRASSNRGESSWRPVVIGGGEWAREAAKALGIPLTYHTQDEMVGPECPNHCGTGTDRLVVFAAGNWWCRRCRSRGWWKEVPDTQRAIAEERLQAEQAHAAALVEMSKATAWRDFHKALYEQEKRLTLWLREGMSQEEIDRWGLGYCKACPLESDHPSLTIPVFRSGVLVDIRHKLLDPVTLLPVPQGNKYRSHLPHLRATIFNVDSLAGNAERLVVVEGEKKAILLSRETPSVWGVPGAKYGRALETELNAAYELLKHKVIVLAFDPDATREAETLALSLCSRSLNVLIADFPIKPDDFLMQYGPQLFNAIIRQARFVRVQPRQFARNR